MRWQNLLLPAAAGAFLVTASCSRNKEPEEATPESQPPAAAPAADSANAAAAAGAAAVDSTAAMTDSALRRFACIGTTWPTAPTVRR